MRVTIRQIASASGLSIQTVSQVLNGNLESFRPETRERVLSTARELGYRRNSSARAMRTGSFGSICLLLSDQAPNSLLPGKLLDGILAAAGEVELAVHIARLPDEILVDEATLPKVLRELSVDGVIIKYDTAFPPEMEKLLAELRLPTVWVNSQHDVDCVYPDELKAGFELTQKLIELGHRKILYFDWLQAGHYSAHERREGYRRAMAEAGLDPLEKLLERPYGGPAEWAENFEWVRDRSFCTAIIGYHAGMAQAAYVAAVAAGRKIPEELSVASFGDGVEVDFMPELGGMVLPLADIGSRAVHLLAHKLVEKTGKGEPVALPHSFSPGKTIGPAP